MSKSKREKFQEELRQAKYEAKMWDEWCQKVHIAVERYNSPTLLQLSEMLGCSIDCVNNIGDAVEGLKIVGNQLGQQGMLRIVKDDG